MDLSTKNFIGFKAQGMQFDAHVTMMYMGTITTTQEEYAQSVVDYLKEQYFLENDGVVARRDVIEMFGYEFTIPVLRLEVPEVVNRIRVDLEDNIGIPKPSPFPWSPHITLSKLPDSDIVLPYNIRLTDLGVY